MSLCFESIIPNMIEDPCNGKQFSTDCLIFSSSIPYLQLPPNSTVTEVINALLLSLVDTRTRLTQAESRIENHETRLIALENA